MANEGSEVIKANNRRVATAKKAAALTARNLQAAQKAEDAAQKALEAAKTAKKVALKEHDEASEELTAFQLTRFWRAAKKEITFKSRKISCNFTRRKIIFVELFN